MRAGQVAAVAGVSGRQLAGEGAGLLGRSDGVALFNGRDRRQPTHRPASIDGRPGSVS